MGDVKSNEWAPPLPHTTQQQNISSNPNMTAITVEPMQENQQTSENPRSKVWKKTIVLFISHVSMIIILFASLFSPFQFYEALLIVSAVLLAVNLINAIVMGVKCPKPAIKFFPIIITTIAALFMLLFYIGVVIAPFEFGPVWLIVLLDTCFLFTGLGLGATIMYTVHGA